MTVFHLHPSAAVYDEAANTPVYCDYRIRHPAALRSSLQSQSLPIAVYKVICDSHVISELLDAFPDGQVIWMYRDPVENAISQLQKFPQPVRAIKCVYRGEPGGGWLAEGASSESVRLIREIDAAELSDLDWACLNWWLRNRTYEEQDLGSDQRVRLLRYETVTESPREVLPQVTDWLGMRRDQASLRFVHSRPLSREHLPPVHSSVERLCNSLLERFDAQQTFVVTPHH